MKKLCLRAALAALLFGAGVLQANATGFYVGAGLGAASVTDQVPTGELDAEDAAYKGFVGFRFDPIPVIDLAVEAAYTDFGDPSQIVGGSSERIKLRGASVAGLLIFPLGPIELFGKAGVISWRAQQTSGATSSNRSGSDPFFGAGVGVNLGKFGVRAEYERFNIQGIDKVQMLSLSALFRF